MLLATLPMMAACEKKPASSTPPHTSLSSQGEEIRHGIDPTHFIRTYHSGEVTGLTDPPQRCPASTTLFRQQCVELVRFYLWHKKSLPQESRITTTAPSKDCAGAPCDLPGYVYSSHSFLAMVPSKATSAVKDHIYPIYSLSSPSGHQYLTRSMVEKENLMKYHGYQKPTVLFYVAPGKSLGDISLYRYRPSASTEAHHFDGPWHYQFGGASANELPKFDGNLGWVLSDS